MKKKQVVSAGDFMQLRRLRVGVTQSGLAELSGVSVATICRLEQGVIRNPDWHTVVRLAAALQCSTDDFIGPLAAAESP